MNLKITIPSPPPKKIGQNTGPGATDPAFQKLRKIIRLRQDLTSISP